MVNTLQVPRPVALAASAVCVAAAAAVIWAMSGSVGHAATTTVVDASQPASFTALAAAPPATTLPKDVQRAAVAAAQHFKVDASAIRAVTTDGVRFWIIPGDGDICVAARDAEGLGMTCDTDKIAESLGLVLLQHSTTGGTDVAYGLAPDDVTKVTAQAPNATASVTPANNVYVVRGTGLSSLKLSHDDGSESSLSVAD